MQNLNSDSHCLIEWSKQRPSLTFGFVPHKELRKIQSLWNKYVEEIEFFGN